MKTKKHNLMKWLQVKIVTSSTSLSLLWVLKYFEINMLSDSERHNQASKHPNPKKWNLRSWSNEYHTPYARYVSRMKYVHQSCSALFSHRKRKKEKKKRRKRLLCGSSAAIFTVCLSHHCCVCAAASAASYSQLKCDSERSLGHLAACTVVLVPESCCQCQDGLRAWMWPLKRCCETQRAGGPQKPLPRFHTYTAATSPEVTQLDGADTPTLTVRKWHQQPVAMTTDDKEHSATAGELIMEAARVPGSSLCPQANTETPREESLNFGSWLLFIHHYSVKWWLMGWMSWCDEGRFKGMAQGGGEVTDVTEKRSKTFLDHVSSLLMPQLSKNRIFDHRDSVSPRASIMVEYAVTVIDPL